MKPEATGFRCEPCDRHIHVRRQIALRDVTLVPRSDSHGCADIANADARIAGRLYSHVKVHPIGLANRLTSHAVTRDLLTTSPVGKPHEGPPTTDKSERERAVYGKPQSG